jgi:hypothetical protein
MAAESLSMSHKSIIISVSQFECERFLNTLPLNLSFKTKLANNSDGNLNSEQKVTESVSKKNDLTIAWQYGKYLKLKGSK